MAHYVMLSSLSEAGRKVLHARPGWIRKVNRELSRRGARGLVHLSRLLPTRTAGGISLRPRRGARVITQYAVLGPYDFVTILEAPDNETVSSISIEMGARGSVQMMTMPAIPLDTFISRLERSRSASGRKGKRRRP